MRYKFLFLLVAFTAPLFSQLSPSYRMTKSYSARELQEWLKQNIRPRFVREAEFGLSGQMSSSWKSVHSQLGSQNQVGSAAGKASNQFKVGVTLDWNYSLGRGWIVTRTQFKNTAGLINGTANDFSLARAYFGYHFTTHGPFVCDLTVGRRTLTRIYNSQIQFSSKGDGATLITSYMLDNIADVRFTSGVYIDMAKTFWILRHGLYNIADLGFYADYTFVYWGNIRPKNNANSLDIKYNLSQFLLGWEYKPEWLKRDLKVFAAMVANHGATRNPLSNYRKENLAGYVGAQFGSAKKKKDFSLQGQLQFCRLQALPEWDVSGVGSPATPTSLHQALSKATINGSTNFQGFEIIFLYSLTDDVTLRFQVDRSLTLNQAFGQPMNYTGFSLETQYTF